MDPALLLKMNPTARYTLQVSDESDLSTAESNCQSVSEGRFESESEREISQVNSPIIEQISDAKIEHSPGTDSVSSNDLLAPKADYLCAECEMRSSTLE